MAREIAPYPQPPRICGKAADLLTQLCFEPPSPAWQTTPQLLFVFGTASSLDELAASLISLSIQYRPPYLLLTGGVDHNDKQPVCQTPQSLMLYRLIQNRIPQECRVVIETQSQNTLENVFFGLKKTPPVDRMIFLAKCYHAGRAYLTLRRFLPRASIEAKSYNPYYPELPQAITKNHWNDEGISRARVWGEFLRIRRYGMRGDIAFEEVSHLVKKIEETVPA